MEILDGIRLEKVERANGDTRRDVASVKQEIRGLQERIRKIEPKVESIAHELEGAYVEGTVGGPTLTVANLMDISSSYARKRKEASVARKGAPSVSFPTSTCR